MPTRNRAAACSRCASTTASACGTRRRPAAARAALQPGAIGGGQRAFPAWRSRDRWTATCAPTPRPTARSCGTSTPSRPTRRVNGVPGRGGSHRRPRSRDRQRHGVRQLRLSDGGRHARQRAARVFGRREIAHPPARAHATWAAVRPGMVRDGGARFTEAGVEYHFAAARNPSFAIRPTTFVLILERRHVAAGCDRRFLSYCCS